MKKILINFLILIGMIFSLSACDEKKEAAEETMPVVKIGVITSLTGRFAENGNNAKAALELAREDVDSDGLDFELIFEDYGYESAKAALAANKLINVDKVDALISWSSMAGNVTAPIAERNNIINFAVSNDKSIPAAGKHNFIHWTQSEALTDKFMEQIADKDYKKIVLFAVYQASLQKDADVLEKLMKEQGIEVERVNFAIDSKDFGLIVDEMKLKDFDAWFVSALPPSLDIFLKTFFQKKVDKPLLAIDSFTFAKDKVLLEGMEYVSVPDGNAALLQRITDKTGSENYFSVGYVYDVGKILMETYNRLYHKLGHLPDSDEVSAALVEIKDYSGAVGKISIGQDRVVHSEAVVKKIADDKVVETRK